MGLGTPPQWFTVLCDTGSPVTWVPSASWCAGAPGCGGHKGFDANASSSDVPGGAQVAVQYGDGTGIGGAFTGDTVHLGGLVVPNVQVALADQGTAPASGVFDGLLGLGLASGVPPGVVAAAFAQGLLAMPLFSFWLNPDQLQPEDGGELLLGGVDEAHAAGPWTWANVTSDTLGGWPVQMEGVWVGQTQVAPAAVAAADTGTSLILGPPDQVAALYDAINAALRGVEGNCAAARLRAPDVAFGVGGARLVLTPKQYLRGGGCEAAFAPVTFANVPEGYPTWLLGDAFLGAYTTVFDMQLGRVGFAQASEGRRVTAGQAQVAAWMGWHLAALVLGVIVIYVLAVEVSRDSTRPQT